MSSKNVKISSRRTSGSKLFRLAVVVFAVYSAVSILQLQTRVYQRRQELDKLNSLCDTQRLENMELERQLSEGDDADYIERTARERLDFVYPYEKVFINASGS